jgi:hypothetical protein
MTRQIVPHKGGRSHSLGNVRITSETKARIAAIRQHYADKGAKWNLSDWIAEKVSEEYQRIEGNLQNG